MGEEGRWPRFFFNFISGYWKWFAEKSLGLAWSIWQLILRIYLFYKIFPYISYIKCPEKGGRKWEKKVSDPQSFFLNFISGYWKSICWKSKFLGLEITGPYLLKTRGISSRHFCPKYTERSNPSHRSDTCLTGMPRNNWKRVSCRRSHQKGLTSLGGKCFRKNINYSVSTVILFSDYSSSRIKGLSVVYHHIGFFDEK